VVVSCIFLAIGMKKGLRPIILLIVLVGLILAFQINAQATGISISPLTFELTANPNDVLTNKLKVYNPTDSIVAIKMEVEDFTVAGEMGEVRIEPAETETYSLAKWVEVEPSEFTLEPREQKFVDFTIAIPQNAEPGGHYGSVLATTAGVMGAGITGAAIAQKVGTLVLLTVAGEVTENLNVKEFSAPDFLEYGPVSFTIRFENTGTVHVRPRGFVTITDWRNKKVIDLEFPQRNVIPGAIRRIDTSFNKKWLFGRYTAMLVGSYGTTNTPLNPSVLTFWVFPWKITLAISLALLLALFILFKTRKRWQLAIRILFKGEPKQI